MRLLTPNAPTVPSVPPPHNSFAPDHDSPCSRDFRCGSPQLLPFEFPMLTFPSTFWGERRHGIQGGLPPGKRNISPPCSRGGYRDTLRLVSLQSTRTHHTKGSCSIFFTTLVEVPSLSMPEQI